MTRALAALALAPAFLLAACGSNVRSADLESQIAAFVHKQTGADITVHCPGHIQAKQGAHVQCTTTLSGAPTVIDIVFLNHGRFRIAQMRVRP